MTGRACDARFVGGATRRPWWSRGSRRRLINIRWRLVVWRRSRCRQLYARRMDDGRTCRSRPSAASINRPRLLERLVSLSDAIRAPAQGAGRRSDGSHSGARPESARRSAGRHFGMRALWILAGDPGAVNCTNVGWKVVAGGARASVHAPAAQLAGAAGAARQRTAQVGRSAPSRCAPDRLAGAAGASRARAMVTS